MPKGTCVFGGFGLAAFTASVLLVSCANTPVARAAMTMQRNMVFMGTEIGLNRWLVSRRLGFPQGHPDIVRKLPVKLDRGRGDAVFPRSLLIANMQSDEEISCFPR